MLKVEFHCHTNYSRDSFTKLKSLITACHERGIDRLVISDHNTTEGAFIAKEMAPDLIIVGEEVLTQQGEILAAYVQEEIPPGLPAVEAIQRLREQGAFISISHPLDPYRGWALADLIEISPLLDALEVFNSRCFLQKYNQNALEFSKQHNLLAIAGSDAHILSELGRATVSMPDFNDTESLKEALPHAEFDLRSSGPWVRIASRSAFIWKKVF